MSTALLERESVSWKPRVRVDKWDDDQTAWVARRSGIAVPRAPEFLKLGVVPYEVVEAEGNLLVTTGLNRLTSLLIGAGGQALSNTATRLGVGDGAGSAAVGDTDLGASAGSTHRWFQVMDATYPQQSNGVVTFKATWATGDGNFAWNEWALDVGTPTVSSSATVGALFFNHKTSAALGTKVSGSWSLTTTVTIS